MILRTPTGLGRGSAAGLNAYARRARERASLIVEAMVGGAVLGVAMVSLYGGFAMGFRSVRLSQEEVRANQILVENLETTRVYDWSKVTTPNFFPTNFTTYFSPPTGTNAVGSGAVYTGRIAVTSPALTESYSNAMRQVTVTVDWTSAGIPRSRSMTTLVSQNGIQTFKD